jgi:hypothetical protein
MPVEGQHAWAVDLPKVVGIAERAASERPRIARRLHDAEEVGDIEDEIIPAFDLRLATATDDDRSRGVKLDWRIVTGDEDRLCKATDYAA